MIGQNKDSLGALLGSVGIPVLLVQITQADRQEKKRLARRHSAARATLPLTLAGLCDYPASFLLEWLSARYSQAYRCKMADLSQIFFRIALDSIISAYREGRDALTSRIDAADEAAADHAAKLDAGEIEDERVDEETGQSFSQTEYLYYQSETRREMLNHHAQAFAIMIHHAWEKHVLGLNPEWDEYRCHQAYGELIKQGFSIDRARLERLRMVANFVKHEGLDILEYHPEMFADETVSAYKKAKEKRQRYVFEDTALRVSDADISDFIDATYRSAGRPGAKQREF